MLIRSPSIFLRTILISVALGYAPFASAHEYFVSLDASMQSMQVEARFAQPVNRISARSREAIRFLSGVENCDNSEALSARGTRLRIPRGGIRCLRYRVDLAAAAAIERRNVGLDDANIVVSPALWFWHPEPSDNSSITVRFDVDDAINVWVPWTPIDDTGRRYRVTRSPGSGSALAAFGNFQTFVERIPGATLRIAILNPENRVDTDKIVRWLRNTANTVNLTYGHFPNPSLGIVVIPVAGDRSRSDSAVYFGRVVRDGGETVELFVDPRQSIEAFYEDWTATHEFSHLMLPYVSSRYRWVSEGFATYYQNVLLARSGQYSEQRAWQRLTEGFERGRNSAPTMSPNEASSNRVRGGTMKVYWSGTAIFLLADVELRRRSNGAESLDDVLLKLQQCCLPSERMWSGPELFQKLDSFLDDPVFMPLYRRHADNARFPDIDDTLRRLGVNTDNEVVQLIDSAPEAELRSAISGR